MTQRLFVTSDGTWGVIDEENLAIVNCTLWTAEDFEMLDAAPASEKISLAVAITDRITREILEDVAI